MKYILINAMIIGIRNYRFFETNQMNIYICTSEILKTRV